MPSRQILFSRLTSLGWMKGRSGDTCEGVRCEHVCVGGGGGGGNVECMTPCISLVPRPLWGEEWPRNEADYGHWVGVHRWGC